MLIRYIDLILLRTGLSYQISIITYETTKLHYVLYLNKLALVITKWIKNNTMCKNICQPSPTSVLRHNGKS